MRDALETDVVYAGSMEPEDVEIVIDVNDYAGDGTALGCGDDNPYR